MRFLIVLGIIAGLVSAQFVPAAAEPDRASGVGLSDVAHTLDGRMLVITGSVTNRGPQPIAQLVVDISGFSPSGDLVAFGSDGIPWAIASGGAERFSVHLLLADRLIRDYTVQVAPAQVTRRPLAGVRRAVDLGLYRPFLLSMVRVRADARPGVLTVRSDARGLPVTQVTVMTTLLIPNQQFHELVTLTLDVPADGMITVPLQLQDVLLLAVRVVDVTLSASWTE